MLHMVMLKVMLLLIKVNSTFVQGIKIMIEFISIIITLIVNIGITMIYVYTHMQK